MNTLPTTIRSLCAALLLCAFALPAQAAPLDAFANLKGSLNIAGGTAHIPVMKDAARHIMDKYPDIRITIAGGGSGVGVEQVGAGLVEIGNTGRPLKESEVTTYGLHSFPFAIDGVAAVTHPANPVHALTTEQLAAIYAGTMTNWKEVGGNDATINVYTREDGSGTRECFVDNGLKKGPIATAAYVQNSNGAMKTAVAQDKNAIGYVSIGHLDSSIAPLQLNGKEPSQENALSMAYPVVRKLYMNTKGAPQGLTKAFIDYLYSPEGAAYISKNGYIPLPPQGSAK